MNTTNRTVPVNKKQALIGSALLLAGIMYYLLGRNPDNVFAIHSIHWLYELNLRNIHPHINNINIISPSFIHICSFILLSAAFLPTVSKERYGILCILWSIICCFFELCQFFKPTIPNILFDLWGIGSAFELIHDYFRYGTYDHNDILFTLLGAIIAYIVLIITINNGGNDAKHI